MRNVSSGSADTLDSYARVMFGEVSNTKAGMFIGTEDGGGGTGGGIDYGTCSHGYTKGFCPYGCDAEIGGVDIVACPDCHRQNGCVCPWCFFCGNKEKNCQCTYCIHCKERLVQCTCFSYPDPDRPVEPGGNGSTGNSGGDNTDKPQVQDILDLVFPHTNLTAQQRQKVKEALDKINQDCLGGKLIGEVKQKGIMLVQDSTMPENGKYNHGKKQLSIRDFKESDLLDRSLERTLLHELLHSVQSGDLDSKMNQEIEARLVVLRYAKNNNMNLVDDFNLALLNIALDARYCVVDSELYSLGYEKAVGKAKSLEHYKEYPENVSKRNVYNAVRLGTDCK